MVRYFDLLNPIQLSLGLLVLVLLLRARQLSVYWPLLVMAIWQAPAYVLLYYLRHLATHLLPAAQAYQLYFNFFWPAYGFSAVCSVLLTRTIFRSAMRPLKGLNDLGDVVFIWVALVSLIIAISVAFEPNTSGTDSLVATVGHLERLGAILTVSLLSFVITAIKPLGLTTRNRVFGASVGTLIVSLTNLLQASRLTTVHRLFTLYGLVQVISSCVALCIWAYYFARPEPERLVLLPTTSPFHYWNDIARRLDQDPGMVAIGGFNPNSFAGAEVEVFRRASAKMKALDEPEGASPRK